MVCSLFNEISIIKKTEEQVIKMKEQKTTFSDILEENRKLMKSFNENSKDNYSFKSKFTRGYLQTNREKGLGKGFTPSSFSTLLYSKGNKYQHNKITNDLKNNSESNFGFMSAHSRTAYYPIDMFDEEKAKKWKIIIALHRLSPEISMKDLVKTLKLA